jgi:hypothetical protein
MQRSDEQVVHERAMGEVSDVLLNLEHTVARAKKALKVVSKGGAEPNAELALAAVVKDLESARKRLMKDTYFAGDAIRLI